MTSFLIRNDAVVENCIATIRKINPELKPTLEVVVRQYRSNRSLNQNSLLHKWFDEIAKGSGEYTADNIKELMKAKFGPKVFVGGEYVNRSSATYSTEEMTEFMDRVSAFAAEFVVELTHPDDTPTAGGGT